ncbi:YfhE family protein [Lysinibacillus endophyticus]|uniref:YfhE family protein n=1 Tax=Ureibacillus endophyticus TaxID=1978490 RepID=A0A494Z7W5_9BACL|nr:YfhE family protein [Lysinibacillus endophyticus]MCP1145018.1 YfhE family protein [Lysinibacillus endophyticus]RKQ18445.1 YfhE family protein [Lysinibacillus endophyticus]
MKNKQPHQQLTVQDNQLTKTQEVLYQKDFKRADRARGKKR